MLPTKRPPTHPGEMLLKEFLTPMGITQKSFCNHLKWTYPRLNEIINKHRSVTADSALALAEAFNMEAEFWLNLQRDWDLWYAKQNHARIKPFKPYFLKAKYA
jgi:antitoxin HigA-1